MSQRPHKKKRKHPRTVWGFASIGAGSVVRGGTVSVQSLKGKTLRASVITEKTSKTGYYSIKRKGLPKKFVVIISGGTAVIKKRAAKKKRISSATQLMTTVPAPQPRVRNTKVSVTIGSTVAARVGIAKWRNAARAKAVKHTRRALAMPDWAQLGVYDRLLSQYVDATQVRRAAKKAKGIDRLLDRITKRALKKGKKPIRLGSSHGSATKRAISVRSSEIDGDISLDDVLDLASPVYSSAVSLVDFLTGNSDDSDPTSAEFSAIESQLASVQNQLNNIETALAQLQDSLTQGMNALSLQLTENQYQNIASTYQTQLNYISTAQNDTQNTVNLSIQYAAKIQSWINQEAKGTITSGQLSSNLNQAYDALEVSYGTMKSAYTSLTSNVEQGNFQSTLVGSKSPDTTGFLGQLWNLIQQARATAEPAQKGTTALATTTLLTHETYDAFMPQAQQAYLNQAQLTALLINWQVIQAIEDANSNGSAENLFWTYNTSTGKLQAVPSALQPSISYLQQLANTVLGSTTQPGTALYYLNAIEQATPQKTVDPLQALDPSTSLMWGNFGSTTWNYASTQPPASSELASPMNMPPTVTTTCNGTQTNLRLDLDFFNTVNGTDNGCAWPGAPVGGPTGTTDPATNWQILSSDPASAGTFTATLGALNSTFKADTGGLYTQVDLATPTQNANPAQKIPGASSVDFTTPTLFPDNGWGKIVYSAGPWSQFMWQQPDHYYGQPMFGNYSLLPARHPAGDFFAFDISSPSAPTTEGRPSYGTTTGPNASTSYAPGAMLGSYFANATMPWADLNQSGSYSSSLAAAGHPDIVAGLAAPWWPIANFSEAGDINSAPSPTLGCASYQAIWTPAHDGVASPTFASANPMQGCTASIIGTRQVNLTDYTWNQPGSTG